MRKKIFYALLLAAMMAAGTVQKARAGVIEDYFSGLKQDVRQTYDEGTWNVMLPLRVWHNRLMTKRKTGIGDTAIRSA